MSATWRYIPPLQKPFKLQMALDYWLLQQHKQGKQPPSLRFYIANPPAISLGRHQRRYPEAWKNITYRGKPLDIVTRPTGGRAVLHQGDLNYMIVTSGLSGRIIDIYKYLSGFLVQGWRWQGVDLSYGKGGKEYINVDNCLATNTPADLVNQVGDKLVGSALLKESRFLLQHGSLRLNSDSQLYQQVFGCLPTPPVNFTETQVIDALVEAAQNYFKIELRSQPLSQSEWLQVYSLLWEEV